MRVRSAGPVTRRAPRNPSDPRASLVSSLRGYSTNARDAYALLDPEASARVWARAAQERNFNAALRLSAVAHQRGDEAKDSAFLVRLSCRKYCYFV